MSGIVATPMTEKLTELERKRPGTLPTDPEVSYYLELLNIRFSGLGVRSVGPVGDFLETLNHFWVHQAIPFFGRDQHQQMTWANQVLKDSYVWLLKDSIQWDHLSSKLKTMTSKKFSMVSSPCFS